MFALSGLAVAALGVLAALIIYGFAWWATSSRSYGAKILVRGGLLLLIAVPLAGFLLLSPTMHSSFDQSEPQLSSPLQDELLREAQQAPRGQTRMQPSAAPRLDEAAPSTGRGMGKESLQPGAPDPSGGSPSPPPAAKMAEETPWSVVPVYFGTDRQEQPSPARLQYNAERGRRLELGRAMVTVPKIHEVPNIERPWVVKIPSFVPRTMKLTACLTPCITRPSFQLCFFHAPKAGGEEKPSTARVERAHSYRARSASKEGTPHCQPLTS